MERHKVSTGSPPDEAQASLEQVVPADGLAAPETYLAPRDRAPAEPLAAAQAAQTASAQTASAQTASAQAAQRAQTTQTAPTQRAQAAPAQTAQTAQTAPTQRAQTAQTAPLQGPQVEVAWLRSTVRQALEAEGAQRRELVDSLSQAFGRIRPSGEPDRAMADYLLGELEAGSLGALVDSRGHSCRARAVEAVLGLGYPYALEVSPEDLEHLRRDSASGAALTPTSVAAMLAAVGGAALAIAQTAGLARFWEVLGPAALAIVGVLVAALSRTGTRFARLGMALLVVAAALGVVVMQNGPREILFAVLGAVVAGLLLFYRE